MFNKLLNRIKHHYKSKRFLFLEAPYIFFGALWLIFAPDKYDDWITYYILAYLFLVMIVDIIDWNKVKKHNQHSDS